MKLKEAYELLGVSEPWEPLDPGPELSNLRELHQECEQRLKSAVNQEEKKRYEEALTILAANIRFQEKLQERQNIGNVGHRLYINQGENGSEEVLFARPGSTVEGTTVFRAKSVGKEENGQIEVETTPEFERLSPQEQAEALVSYAVANGDNQIVIVGNCDNPLLDRELKKLAKQNGIEVCHITEKEHSDLNKMSGDDARAFLQRRNEEERIRDAASDTPELDTASVRSAVSH